MKKLFAVMLFLTVTSVLVSQENVTRFLDIPLRGCKPMMIEKLKAKGFYALEGREQNEIFRGSFLDNDVFLMIGTRDGEVCSIKLSGVKGCNSEEVKALFNRLCDHFATSGGYLAFSDNQTISENEDIAVGMSKYGKLYKAHFVQVSESDSLEFAGKVELLLKDKFGKDLKSTDEDIVEEINLYAHDCYLNMLSRKAVWFYISEFFNRYYINCYFENLHEFAGQDIVWF